MSMKQIMGLPGKPDQGYLKFLHDRSSVMAGLSWIDISYHPGENWIKIWYGEELTGAQEAELEALVSACQISSKFKLQEGEEYFEHKAGNKRGSKHRSRVKFRSAFASEPTIEIFNAELTGLANMELVKTTLNGFNFLVEANGSRKGDAITTMQFQWRAWTT